MLLLITLAGIALALPTPETNETDNQISRKVLGSSVVTSVSVIMDVGNGSQTYFSDAVGKPMTKPLTATQLASPINLLNPDRYEFYTFDDSGDLVRRLMTLDEIQGIIASGDGDSANYNSQSLINLPEQRVDDVISNVQNVLKEEMEAHKPASGYKPEFDRPDVTSTWNLILPAIFGNSDHLVPDLISETSVKSTTNAPITTTEISTTQKSSVAPTTTTASVKTESPIISTTNASLIRTSTKKITTSTVTSMPSSIKMTSSIKPYTSSPYSIRTTSSTTPDMSVPSSIKMTSLTKPHTPSPYPIRTTTSTTQHTTVPSSIKMTSSTKPHTSSPYSIRTTSSTTPHTSVPSSIKMTSSTKPHTSSPYSIRTTSSTTPHTSSPYSIRTTSSTTPHTSVPGSIKMTSSTKPHTSSPYSIRTTSSTTSHTFSPYSIRTTSSTTPHTSVPSSIKITSSTKPHTSSPYSIRTTSSTILHTSSPYTIRTTSSTALHTSSPYSIKTTSSTTPPTSAPNLIKIASSSSIENTSLTTPPTTSPTSTKITSTTASLTSSPSSTKTTFPTTTFKSSPSSIKITSSAAPSTVPQTTHIPEKLSTFFLIGEATEKLKTSESSYRPLPLTFATTTEEDVYSGKEKPETTTEDTSKLTTFSLLTELTTTENIISNDDSTVGDVFTTEPTYDEGSTTSTSKDIATSATTADVLTTNKDVATLTSLDNDNLLSTTEVYTESFVETTTVIPEIGSTSLINTESATESEFRSTIDIKSSTTTEKEVTTEQQLSTLDIGISTESPTTSDPSFADTNTNADDFTEPTTSGFLSNEEAETNYPVTSSTVSELDNVSTTFSVIDTTTISESKTTELSDTTTTKTADNLILEPSTTLSSDVTTYTDLTTEKFEIDINVHNAFDSLLSQIINQEPSQTTIENFVSTDNSKATTLKLEETTTVSNLDDESDKNRYEEMELDNLSLYTTVNYEGKTVQPSQDMDEVVNTSEKLPSTEAAIEATTELVYNTSNSEYLSTTELISSSITSIPNKNLKTDSFELVGLQVSEASADYSNYSTTETTIATCATKAVANDTEVYYITEATIENVTIVETETPSTIQTPEFVTVETVTPPSAKVDKLEVHIINRTVSTTPKTDTTWTLVSTLAPHRTTASSEQDKFLLNAVTSVDLVPKPLQGFGLADSTSDLEPDVFQFTELCNELAFSFWSSVTSGISFARSVVISPFAATSILAMVFLGARGSTSGEMNEILKLDDMVTFNPHAIFKNVVESIEVSKKSGVATSVFVKELYSDKNRGKLLSFYKERVKQFYDGHVEEVNFKEINDIIRRRTNLLVKRQTWGKVPEYLKDNNLFLRPPLAAISANLFQTDCSESSTNGRDGELHFVVLPSIRQRKLVPIPAVVWRSGFLAGYEPGLDATAVAIGKKDHTISTIFVIPGQQGISAPGDGLVRLETRLIESAFKQNAWSRLLRSLIPRPGLEVQIPRFSHKSIINATAALQRMGLKDLFNANSADLKGLNGVAHELYLSDIVQINTFATCGENKIDETHHSEIYPATTNRAFRRIRKIPHYSNDKPYENSDLSDEPRDYQRAFHDPLYDPTYLSLPLQFRPRQARLPDPPRLRFDRPFLYFVRHNPTGLLLHMGRFNPRLLP